MTKENNDFNLMIDDKFRVIAEPGNFILQEYCDIESKKSNEEGVKEVRQDWKFRGYFGKSISGALRRYLQEDIQQQGNTSVHRLIETIQQAEKRIDDVVTKNKLKLYEQLKEMQT